MAVHGGGKRKTSGSSEPLVAGQGAASLAFADFREGCISKYTAWQGGEEREFRVVEGEITDSTRFFEDEAEFGGTLPLPAGFDPRTVPFSMTVTSGEFATFTELTFTAAEARKGRWTARKGRYTLKFRVGNDHRTTVVIDAARSLFVYSRSRFSFTQRFANPVTIRIALGDLTFETKQTWRVRPSRPGRIFSLP